MFIFLIHQVCTRLGLAVCMLCMVLTLSTGSFLFRGLIAYVVGDVTRGAGPQFFTEREKSPFYLFREPEGSQSQPVTPAAAQSQPVTPAAAQSQPVTPAARK